MNKNSQRNSGASNPDVVAAKMTMRMNTLKSSCNSVALNPHSQEYSSASRQAKGIANHSSHSQQHSSTDTQNKSLASKSHTQQHSNTSTQNKSLAIAKSHTQQHSSTSTQNRQLNKTTSHSSQQSNGQSTSLSQPSNLQRPLTQPHSQRQPALDRLKSMEETINSLERRIVSIETENRSMSASMKQMEVDMKSMSETINSLRSICSSTNKMLKEMTKRPKATNRPPYLPFKSCADLLAFNNISDEEYDDFVRYLLYLGGANPTDAAAKFFKSCFNFGEDLFRYVTWHGSRTDDNMIALKDTRFSSACEDAMPFNQDSLDKPNEVQFAWAMTKALKSAKEGFRRKRKPLQRQFEEEEPRIQRRRFADLQDQPSPPPEEEIPAPIREEDLLTDGDDQHYQEANIQEEGTTLNNEETQNDTDDMEEVFGTQQKMEQCYGDDFQNTFNE